MSAFGQLVDETSSLELSRKLEEREEYKHRVEEKRGRS